MKEPESTRPTPQSAAATYRPGLWIGLVTALGCAAAIAAVLAVHREKIVTRIVMRRIWFNQSLSHHDRALADLEALKPSMLHDRSWQDTMLYSLKCQKAWTAIAALATTLERENIHHEEWVWQGTVALIHVGRDTPARVLARKALERHASMMSPGRRIFCQLAAADDRTTPPLPTAIDIEELTADEGLDGDEKQLLRCLAAESMCMRGDWENAVRTFRAVAVNPDHPTRGLLSHTPLLLRSGRRAAALQSLDLFVGSSGGAIDPLAIQYLDRSVAHIPFPMNESARAAVSEWRRHIEERTLSMPNPASPDFLSIGAASDIRIDSISIPSLLKPGNAMSLPFDLHTTGAWAFEIKGRSNRIRQMGSQIELWIEGAGGGITYVPSTDPAIRRMVMHLPAGSHTLTIHATHLAGTEPDGFAWVDSVHISPHPGPVPAGAANERDFRMVGPDGREMTPLSWAVTDQADHIDESLP